MVVGGHRHTPAALPPGKTRYPLYRKLGGPQGRSGRLKFPPSGIRSQTVQTTASRYRLSYPGPETSRYYQVGFTLFTGHEDP
jgi:hypothetical protein